MAIGRCGAHIVTVIALIEACLLLPAQAAQLPNQSFSIDGDGADGNQFAEVIATSGDTCALLARGSGAIEIFVLSNSTWVRQQRINPTNLPAGARIGSTLALSGDSLAVRVLSPDSEGVYQLASVRIFQRTAGVWAYQSDIFGFSGAPQPLFAAEMAFDGNSLIVSDQSSEEAPLSTSVFVRNGVAWGRQASIARSGTLTIEGDTLLIGIPSASVSGKAAQGTAYAYTRTGSSWTQQAQLIATDGSAYDEFGKAVSLDGDTAIVGAYGHLDELNENGRGAAYVFIRSNGVWSQQGRLAPSAGSLDDSFGLRLAVSGNYALVGAPTATVSGRSDVGAAYIFVRSGTSWTQQAQLSSSNGASLDGFGYGLALRGTAAWIGAPFHDTSEFNDQGLAYEFVPSGDTWQQQSIIQGTVSTAPHDHLGSAVASSGDTLAVGAPQDQVAGGQGRGSVYVYTRSAGGNWELQAHVLPVDGEGVDGFGTSVAISGDTMVVGSPYDAISDKFYRGSVFIFTRASGIWSQQYRVIAGDGVENDGFGSSVGYDGTTLVVGSPGTDSGALIDRGSVYVYVGSGDNWTGQGKFSASDAASYDAFGDRVAVVGDTILASAKGDDVGANNDQGSVYAFVRNGDGWVQQAKLLALDAAANDRFGRSLALRASTALVGANGDDGVAGPDQGSAYVFQRTGTTWSQQAKLTAPDALAFDYLGQSVALTDDTALVGGLGDGNVDTAHSVGAYVFERSGNSWSFKTRLDPGDTATSPGNWFGFAVAVTDDAYWVGAPHEVTSQGEEAGVLYGYERVAAPAQSYDFGDAPDPQYPTLLANQGARHLISALMLGSKIDAEADGLPNSSATGDDLSGTDDEDGVSFGTLKAGKSATLTAYVSGAPAALLDVWIDFNQDGDWSDADERVFSHYTVVQGSNALSFKAPRKIPQGQTFARIRLSTAGTEAPTGAAADGEVEDVQVTVQGGRR